MYTKLGYKFSTLSDVEQAMNQINDFFGIPISEESLTRNYTDFEIVNGLYVIWHLPELNTVLGVPDEIEIPTNSII